MQELSEHPCIMTFVVQVEKLSRRPVIYINIVAVLVQGYIHWTYFVLVLVCFPSKTQRLHALQLSVLVFVCSTEH